MDFIEMHTQPIESRRSTSLTSVGAGPKHNANQQKHIRESLHPPSSIVAPSLKHREAKAVEVAPERKHPANSPHSGAPADSGGEEPPQQQFSPISPADLSSMPPRDQDTQWQLDEDMSAVTSPSSLTPPDWGGEMACEVTPIEDQVVKVVLVVRCWRHVVLGVPRGSSFGFH